MKSALAICPPGPYLEFRLDPICLSTFLKAGIVMPLGGVLAYF